MAEDNTPEANGPWAVRTREVRYDNPWLRLEHSTVVHPDGSDGIYGVVRFKNLAIGVLPVFEDGTVPLVGQHRFPLNRYSWELPEGGGPLSTTPLDAAKRELIEETGYSAAHWAPLIEFDVSNSVTDEQSVCFLAWGLSSGPSAPEASEDLSHKRVAFSDLVAQCLDGQIRDGLTLVMALSAEAKARRGELPADVAGYLAST
ncbi:MAG: NUDIX hydrolase [Pseudomonadota bacterium]